MPSIIITSLTDLMIEPNEFTVHHTSSVTYLNYPYHFE